ncbi:MAG TPA: hypothetical protein VFJ16_02920 [Longimicrobium sp.]|nr:hypothetical protein [Longimicrobium sp.]
MSVFDFPRFHFQGLMLVDVGTGNNDDYSFSAVMGPDYPSYEMDPLRQSDSPNVQPLTYGMTDDQWVAWAQVRGEFRAETRARALKAGIPGVSKSEGGAAQRAGGASVWYIPGEWNYYGDMGLTMLDITVASVVPAAGTTITDPAADPVIGAAVSYNNRPDSTGRSTGVLVDINAEDVPASMVVTQFLTVAKDGQALLSGLPTKAVTRFINFQRSYTLNGPNGAGCLFQSIVPVSALPPGTPLLARFAPAQGGVPLTGVIFHYYLYRPLQVINTFKFSDAPSDQNSPWFEKMETLYRKSPNAPGGQPTPGMPLQEVAALMDVNGRNPDYIQVVGTIAPAYGNELDSCPAGRMLVPVESVPAPGATGNANPADPQYLLAPAVVTVNRATGMVSADFSGTFPDRLDDDVYDPLVTASCVKWSFGPVTLTISDGTTRHDVGTVEYTDTAAGNLAGWIFDFPISGLSSEVQALLDTGTFALYGQVSAPGGGTRLAQLLVEQEYLVVSDQACIFGEQLPGGGTLDRFTDDDGIPSPSRIRVFRKGVELAAGDCPPVTVWEYNTTPNQDPGPLTLITTGFGPGQDLTVNAADNGNRLYTFTVQGQAAPPGFTGIRATAQGSDDDGLYPPMQYGKLPLGFAPMINLRILPNNVDYSHYYVPGSDPPVGNATLTFEAIYREVLRNYYLLYPAMNQRIPLNDPEYWNDPEMARRLYERTQLSWWPRAEYMPRTRDLSASRRELLHAWARTFFPGGQIGLDTTSLTSVAPPQPAGPSSPEDPR